MEFRLLGPLEVIDDHRTAPLGGPKQRIVLAHLLLEANHVVTVERLIDALWGDDPPASARNTLQTYIKHLRKVLGADAIEHVSSGYALRVDPSGVDALRFEALVEESHRLSATDAPRASLDLREALGLWRGPALDDLSEQPSLAAERARLDEMRLTAVEDRIAVDLELGRHRDLIPELETMIGRHPYRERSWGSLMLALYRAGRQGEALAAYQRAREVLLDELGIDPSSDLRRLQEQILKQDPGLEAGGDALRGYRLLEQLGEGAFGAVYRAYQPEVGREVAVKIVHPRLANHPEFIRRFATEAQLIARLEHPHIVPLYDYWREPDGAFLVMRYLRGGNLRQRLAESPLDLDLAVSVLDQVTLALAAAHRQGVIHRDVQPANVLFDEEGNAYLSDFGIALDLAATGTSPGGGGTFAYYQSPEEARGEPITHRTDIYSLGLVLYECLTGRHALSENHDDTVPSISIVRDDLPGALDDVIARATALDPSDRFADALAFEEALHTALAAPAAGAHIDRRNPYKGLRAFVEADSMDFFGRDDAIDELAARMRETRFLAVVGPSGSGKSSLVRAGLIPRLRAGRLPGSEHWFVVDMIPGAQPFDELRAGLARIASEPRPGDLERLRTERGGLARIADEILPEGAELVVMVDQFEEVFTLVEDEDERRAFLEMLAAAADAAGRVRVIVTVRADFYDRPLMYKAFGDLLAASTYAVTPLAASEIEAAVVDPAASVGVAVGPGLVGEVVADVADRPGTLPLLQFALTVLFDGSPDGVLTPETYRTLGGVSGALARAAEDLYDGLDPAGKEAARQLFLRLVDVAGGSASDTRRRVPRSELVSLDVEPDAMVAVIDAFGARRLLSFDRDPSTRGPTVEVAHEALLREWTRLRGWIEAAREDLRTERRLSSATTEWEAQRRDPGFLLRGSRLDQLATWSGSTALALSHPERDYLVASLDQAEAEREAEGEREERERRLERRSVRRLRTMVAVLTVGVLVAASLTAVATDQRRRAEREARIAQARALASAAIGNLDVDPERSLLLALEAVDATRSVDGTVLPEAEDALHQAVGASRAVMTLPDIGGSVDWSPSGELLAAEGPLSTGIIDLRDARSGRSVRSFQAHEREITGVTFSPDGSRLATTGTDGMLNLWDPSTGDLAASFRGDGSVWGPSFSPDGSLAAAAWPSERTVRILDASTGELIRTIEHLSQAQDTSFSPDGRRMAVAAAVDGHPGVVVDVGTGDRVLELQGEDGPFNLAWSPDGRYIANAWSTWVWDAETGKIAFGLEGHRGAVQSVDWSPDSSRLVTGGNDGTVKVWEIGDRGGKEILTLASLETQVDSFEAAFSPDGTRVVAGDGGDAFAGPGNTTVKVWDLTPAGIAEWAIIRAGGLYPGGAEFMPTGRRLYVNRSVASIALWDFDIGVDRPVQTIDLLPRPSDSWLWEIATSPDGRSLAITIEHRTSVRDAATGAEIFAIDADEVAWHPSGKALVAAHASGPLVIYDVSGHQTRVLEDDVGSEVYDLRFSPDGSLMSSAEPYRKVPRVRIWNWERGEVITEIPTFSDTASFDPTGTRIVTTATPPSIWDVRTGDRVSTLTGQTGGNVWSAVFSPDGSVVALGGSEGSVQLLDPATGVQVLVLRGHAGYVSRVAFSADGTMLASRSPEDGTVRVWALDIDDLLEIARQKVTRQFTDEECRTYLDLATCPSLE